MILSGSNPGVAHPVCCAAGKWLLQPGQRLYFNRQSGKTAVVLAVVGDLPACNGWEHWYYANEQGELVVIDTLREKIRQGQTQR